MKNRILKLSAVLFLTLSVLLTLVSCGSFTQTLTAFSLDTVCQITVYHKKDVDKAKEALSLLSFYEDVFSRTKEDAELYLLNASAGEPAKVSEDLYNVLERALYFSELSGGMFDITLGGVSSLYRFNGDDPAFPDEKTLSEALTHVGHSKVLLGEDRLVTVTDPETKLDLGAIAKGYIADRLKDHLVSSGVTSALISLGGNLAAVGAKPGGKPYVLGIRYPEKNSKEIVTTLEVTDASLVTSGVYERSFMKDGVLYHHLLDPNTGRPAVSGWLSCSVLTSSSEDADALSTLCFLLGPEASKTVISAFPGTRCVFIAEDLSLTWIGEE